MTCSTRTSSMTVAGFSTRGGRGATADGRMSGTATSAGASGSRAGASVDIQSKGVRPRAYQQRRLSIYYLSTVPRHAARDLATGASCIGGNAFGTQIDDHL